MFGVCIMYPVERLSMNTADTRPSLLIRIRDPDDSDAWNEFTNIYRPAIVHLAMFRGLQHADAEDLAQQVLVTVSKAIKTWNPDNKQARFRTWLARVTHNAAINSITRSKPDLGSGNSKVVALLDAIPNDTPDSQLLNLEIRREAFRYAAQQIQIEFAQDTWTAFWETAVLERSIDEIAKQLNKKPGAIYAARSRVMRRLREKINELELLENI